MIHLTGFSLSVTSSLGELGLPLRKTSMDGETCLSPARFLGEVKLSLVNFILYLGEMGPPFGNIGLSGETCLSLALFIGELNFPTILSFRGVNLPIGEKAFFLEKHSINRLASFSLREINLPYEGVGLSTTFSLGGMNSSREFVLPLGESFLFLENRL